MDHKDKCKCKICIEFELCMYHADRMKQEQRDFFMDLMEKVMYERIDANYNKAILDGNWPNAVEILEERLEKAKQNRLEKNEQNSVVG